MGIFIYVMHITMSCEDNVAVGCVLAHIGINVGSIWPYRMRAAPPIFFNEQPF